MSAQGNFSNYLKKKWSDCPMCRVRRGRGTLVDTCHRLAEKRTRQTARETLRAIVIGNVDPDDVGITIAPVGYTD